MSNDKEALVGNLLTSLMVKITTGLQVRNLPDGGPGLVNNQEFIRTRGDKPGSGGSYGALSFSSDDWRLDGSNCRCKFNFSCTTAKCDCRG